MGNYFMVAFKYKGPQKIMQKKLANLSKPHTYTRIPTPKLLQFPTTDTTPNMT